jgi:SAM-dependent methyltransferase
MNTQRIHQQTGAAWDQAAANYERSEAEDIEFLRSSGNSLMAAERRILGELHPWCRRAIHLQCAGGTDTLSLLAQGAQEVVGTDISARMIAVARRKAEALGASAMFHVCDTLAVPHDLDGTADLVYTGRGALPWMMDIDAWARVVERLLKPNGKLYVFEGHPLDWVWDMGASEYRLDPVRGDYFSEVLSDQRWPNPMLDGMISDGDRPRAREHQWTLGNVLNALVAVGLRLDHFEEHPDLYWGQFPHLPEDLARKLPHTFSLLMRKA